MDGRRGKGDRLDDLVFRHVDYDHGLAFAAGDEELLHLVGPHVGPLHSHVVDECEGAGAGRHFELPHDRLRLGVQNDDSIPGLVCHIDLPSRAMDNEIRETPTGLDGLDQLRLLHIHYAYAARSWTREEDEVLEVVHDIGALFRHGLHVNRRGLAATAHAQRVWLGRVHDGAFRWRHRGAPRYGAIQLLVDEYLIEREHIERLRLGPHRERALLGADVGDVDGRRFEGHRLQQTAVLASADHRQRFRSSARDVELSPAQSYRPRSSGHADTLYPFLRMARVERDHLVVQCVRDEHLLQVLLDDQIGQIAAQLDDIDHPLRGRIEHHDPPGRRRGEEDSILKAADHIRPGLLRQRTRETLGRLTLTVSPPHRPHP